MSKETELYTEGVLLAADLIAQGSKVTEVIDRLVEVQSCSRAAARRMIADARAALRKAAMWSAPESMAQLAHEFFAISVEARHRGDLKTAVASLTQYRTTIAEHGGDEQFEPGDVARSLLKLLDEFGQDLSIDEIQGLQDALSVAKRRAPTSQKRRREYIDGLARVIAGVDVQPEQGA